VFGDRRGQIVIDDFSGDTTQHSEGVHVAASESLEALAMRELDIEHATVRIDQREGIEFARVAGIVERAEMPPVHFEAFASERFHAHKGTLSRELGPHCSHILLQDAWTQLLLDDCGGDARIFFQPLRNVAFKLNGSSLLPRARVAGPWAGASRYFLMFSSPYGDGARFYGWASVRTSKTGAGR
jgi:hypothetical protein